MCRYEEVEEGKHVGSTNCRKIPVSLCATSACTFVEGPEVCHNKSQVNGKTVDRHYCQARLFARKIGLATQRSL